MSSQAKTRRLTKAQREWCKNYHDSTGFEPMIADFREGRSTFYEAARAAIHWYDMHFTDAMRSITHNIPGEDEAFDAKFDAIFATPDTGGSKSE